MLVFCVKNSKLLEKKHITHFSSKMQCYYLDEPKDDCLALLLNGSWQGVDCFEDKPYVCQLKSIKVPTTTLKLTSKHAPQITTKETTTHPNNKTTLGLLTSTIHLNNKTTTESTTIKHVETTQSSTTTHRPTTTTLKLTTKQRKKNCASGWSYLASTNKCYSVISFF